MTKTERFISYFVVAVIFLFAGNFWRMAQESNYKNYAYSAGQSALLADIEREAIKGWDFFITIEDRTVHFYPIKERRKK